METTSTPAFLNTTYVPVESESFGLQDYFKATGKLGSYSVINVHLNPREAVQVVVDAHLPWLQAALDEHFAAKIVTLDLNQIETFITWLRGRKSRFELQTLLGLAPHRRIGNNKYLRVLYLDDIKSADAHHPLVLSLFMQMLLERYTKLDSRVAVLETRQGEKMGRSHVVLLRERQQFKVLDPSGRVAWLHGAPCRAPSTNCA
jgi:hypothetical protein